jgi:signal transduction histidine kinase
VTLFAPATGAATALEPDRGDGGQNPPVKRPPRWSVRNWPVRSKVLAIALVPTVLALVFGGLRIAGAVSDAGELRRAADRAEVVPAITDYMAALGAAWVAASDDTDSQGARQARKNYEGRKHELQTRLAGTDVADDVRSGLTALVDGGRDLLDKVAEHSIALQDQVTSYAPILLTAEGAIDGSVRIDSERLRAQTQGLSRAVGARGQMTMQELLVTRGGELPEAFLRTSMSTLAGTEPSTLSAMSQVLGVDSPDAKTLQQQYVHRMALISDPDAVLAGNQDLLDSIMTTDAIAGRVIEDTADSVPESVRDRARKQRNAAIRDIALVSVAMAGVLVVVMLGARSLVRPLRTLRDGALKIAHTDLEDEIARVRAGDEREPPPLPVHTTEEVGQVAHAVDELHAQALLLAGDEARLRLLVNDMFETMSRRNRSLVDQQLSLIEQLERDEGDPDRLDSLFRLDHLAARMRRNGANLLVLADAKTSRDQQRAVALSTVIDAATSEVEDYRRVETAPVPEVTVTGMVTDDTIHLLAELIDNALRYSPPTAPVRVSAARTDDGGVRVAVRDTGLGMTNPDLRIANMRLGSSGEANPENARHMGLFVAGRLARRHGMKVRLRVTDQRDSGITAEVHLPPSLLVGALPSGSREQAPAATPHETTDSAEPAAAAEPALPWWEIPRDDGHERQPASSSPVASSDDLIYQRMLSESLVDPHEPSAFADLDWKSVWDHGWSVAAEAEQVPVAAHTEQGLPVREPGARLVPGAPSGDEDVKDQSGCAPSRTARDPEAIRASIGSHFGGVRAGRSHARHAEQRPHQ